MSDGRRPLPAWVWLLACTLLAYGTALAGTFVYDDLHAVRDNEAIRSLGNVPRFFHDPGAFSALDNRMYRPVLLVSYALDHALGGGAPWVFKLSNLLLHFATALAVYHVARRLRAPARPALLAACVFAAHPLGSEAVNTISGRSELLLALGLLGGVLAHCRARGDSRWALLTAAAAVVACGSKETGVVLPALLVAVDPPWRARGEIRRWLVRHAAPALVVLAYLLVRRALFGVATAAVPPATGGAEVLAGHGRDLVTQLCTMATILPRALAQCVLPIGLTLDPDVHFVRTPYCVPVLAGALFVAALTWLGLRRPSRAPARAFGALFAWMASLPWIVLPLNSPYLEHRMYGALAGLALVLSAVLGAAPSARRVALAAGAALAAFVPLAAQRSLDYRDPGVLWRKVVAAQPGSVRGLCGLAVWHMERGELAAALPLVQRAVAIWPTHAAALRNLAELHIQLAPDPGSGLAAVIATDRLVAAEPENPFDRLLSSRALATLGEETGDSRWFDAAVAQALACLEFAPPKGLVFRTAASARLRQGRPEEALALLDESVRRGLDHSSVLLDRAAVLRRLGRLSEAERDLRRALEQDPFDPHVLAALRQRAAAPGR